MSEITINNILASGFLVIWILTLLWYQFLKNRWDGGSAIIVTYIIYGIFSLLTLNNPLFSMAFKPLKIFPYIYLYIMMIIALSPLIIHHYQDTSIIENPHTRVLDFISILLIICTILLLPGIFSDANGGLLSIFTNAAAGKEAYLEQIEKVEDSGSTIHNLPAIFFNAFIDIGIFVFFYYLTLKKKNIFIITGLSLTIVVNIIIPISLGQRGGVVIGMFTILGGYMLFKQYLSNKIKQLIRNIGIIAIILVSLPLILSTVSRFGDESASVGGFVNWYVGQGSLYFNNFGLDPGGCRHGDRTLNLFKRLIDPNTPKNFVERRDKYHNLNIDDNFFTTFVGDFTIDYGPITAAFIFIIFYFLVIRLTKERGDTIKLYQLLLLYFTLCISLQGGMTLFSYSDIGGNLRLLNYILLYIYLRYHEQLILKFPLKIKKRTTAKL